MNKQKIESKDKICNICRLVIDTNKEFAKLTHYKKDNDILSEMYYHISCYLERLRGSANLNALQSRANKILTMAEQRLA